MKAHHTVKYCAPETFPDRPPWMLLFYGQLHHLAGSYQTVPELGQKEMLA
jgi:hypothetical protein